MVNMKDIMIAITRANGTEEMLKVMEIEIEITKVKDIMDLKT